MRSIWTDQRKLEIWLEIELLAAEALSKEGIVPEKDFRIMKKRASFKLERCRELEKTLNHDVIAFTTNVAENINHKASRWLHFGLTSSDIGDTAFGVQIKESADILIDDLKKVRKVIAVKAKKYQMTPMIGRSHGIHGEPTSFGLKLALMYDEFGRALKRMESVKRTASLGKISGAVGTNAHLSPKVESFVCRKLGLTAAPLTTQVIQRDIHAEFMTTLALVAASIERWSTEFRHLQRTEVLEAEEFFAKGQKGSSAMPHKRNPITWERLTGQARVIRGNALAAMENVALWHERDISHSSVERVIFPDSCALLDYMLHKLEGLIKGLIVYPENMKRNLGISLGMWNSQSVLLELIRKGLSRENAYELVQRSAMLTWKAKHAGKGEADFKTQLLEDPDVRKHLTKGDLDRICNLDFHLKNVKQRFRKVGIK
jgi:adenylosuccinate lyase